MLTLLLEAALKGSILLGCAAALTTLMQRRSAAARHLVWGMALLAAALMPVAARLLPAWRVSLPLAMAPAAVAASEAAGQADSRTNSAALPPSVSPPSREPASVSDFPTFRSPHRASGGPRLSVSAALTLTWALVATLLLGRLLAGSLSLTRLSRRAAPITDPSLLALLAEAARVTGVRRPVRLLASESTGVPVTWGLVRPVLLLPPDHEEWSAERRRAVLIHELAHVARRDSVTHLAAQLCCAFYWFNPLVWLAARALRSERERACDDCVLTAGTVASAYAGELLDIARTSLGLERHAVALAMARRSELEGRLLAILNPALRRSVPPVRTAVLLGAAALVYRPRRA